MAPAGPSPRSATVKSFVQFELPNTIVGKEFGWVALGEIVSL